MALEEAMLRDKNILVVPRGRCTWTTLRRGSVSVGTLVMCANGPPFPTDDEGARRRHHQGRCGPVFSRKGYFDAEISRIETSVIQTDRIEALRRSILEQFEHYVTLHPKIPSEVVMSVMSVEDSGQMTDLISSHLLVKVAEKQQLLEILDPEQRMEHLLKILLGEIEILELEHDIHDRVRREMERSHREYYIKEQLRSFRTSWVTVRALPNTRSSPIKSLRRTCPRTWRNGH
jgi:ATP-dependent Lon protease